MNKKKLSVVMAGAMLATSVAPVLAAETTATEVNKTNLALLQRLIEDKMNEGQVSTNKALVQKLNTGSSQSDINHSDIITTDVAAEMVVGSSKYGIRVLDKDGKAVDLNAKFGVGTSGDTATYKKADIATIIADTDLSVGMTIEIVERKTNDFHGEIIPGTLPTVKKSASIYGTIETTVTEAMKAYLGINTWNATSNKSEYKTALIDTTNIDDVLKVENGNLIVTTKKLNSQNTSDVKTIKLTPETKMVDGRLAVDAEGKLIDATNAEDIQKFDHFLEGAEEWNASTLIDDQVETNLTKVSSYKIVEDSATVENLTIADITDGISLTARASELLTDLKNAATKVEEKNPGNTANTKGALVQITQDSTFDAYGIYKLDIKYYANKKDALNVATATPVKTVSITSNKASDITNLKGIFEGGNLKVATIGGANRYATAVNVAKAQGITKLDKDVDGTATMNNIVIVNGTSLVDGLAAAPLAAELGAYEADNADTATTKVSAPLLLSEADKLPTATKEYLVELTNEIAAGDLKNKVTVNLVGGEGVLSESLEKELKDMGFKVERFGGDNREETSLEVASQLVKTTDAKDPAFVVGANGEADAMSIAAVAAKKKTPIIVSSVHGLTKDAVKFIEKHSSHKDADVRIIGGESVVTKEEAEKLDEVVKGGVSRIAGANRIETNAKVIEAYFKTGAITGTTGVVAVKDGIATKNELIDALSAANYAAGMNAPVVLASEKIADNQKNALLKMDGTVANTIQVGEGSSKDVLTALANFFDLTILK